MKIFFAFWFAVLGCSSVFADQALAAAKNCMACHAPSMKLVGPSFKDIATRYARATDAADTLKTKIRTGSVGVWGAVPMPASPNLSEAEASRLAAWVLSQR